MDCCNLVYIGILLCDTLIIIHAKNGKVIISTQANTGSNVNVTKIPPIKRIGALTPKRCILPII